MKLSRSNNQPWGFRLSGGVDFAFPLTAVRVTIGGTAHKAGLIAGDIIMKINGESIQHLTNTEALNKVINLGNQMTFTVVRNLKLQKIADHE